MTKVVKNSLTAVLIFALSSCQLINDDTIDSQADGVHPEYMTVSVPRPGIDRETVVLSSDDARFVAEKYLEKNPITKSSDKSVKDIIPVLGENGEPMIYAVNFNDGYIWISARTDYYPILAEVDNGAFDLDSLDNGVAVILEELIENIAYVASLGDYDEYKNSWMPYMAGISDNWTPTKVWTTEEQWRHHLLTQRLKEEEYDYEFLIYSDRLRIPDDIYNRFCELAEMYSFGDEHLRDLAVVAKKHVEQDTEYGPYLKTKWHQNANFNSGLSSGMKLGCVTVAVGQIMRYLEYPTYINWSGMSNVMATSTSVEFLTNLRSQLKVDKDGGSTITNAKDVFNQYGYNCEIVDHTLAQSSGRIKAGYPVYMRGQTSTFGDGHAWVCDGYRLVLVHDEYQLYSYYDCVPDGKDYGQTGFERKYTLSNSTLHMNWGWGGSNDGWFFDFDIATSNGDFKKKREDIIITGHN